MLRLVTDQLNILFMILVHVQLPGVTALSVSSLNSFVFRGILGSDF